MKNKNFQPVSASSEFAQSDHEILKLWKTRDIFKKCERLNPRENAFVFYDGPPGTNGRPHIGHIMQSALKDLWPRFKTMQGYSVLRKAGWDTHGLPVELTAEAELKLSGKVDIEKFGVSKFVDHCRSTVLKFRDDWVKAIDRIGRFLDFDNDYLTMSNDFIQSDWWVLQQIFKKGLLYNDFKIIPYCSRCGTGLSSHEVALGYQDVTDLSITARFPLADEPTTHILAWTTTPWTLLGNVGLVINPKDEYSKVAIAGLGGHVILASATIERNEKALGADYRVVATFPGSSLEGRSYIPLWDFSKPTNGAVAHRVVCDSYVTTEDGTGAVHLAFYGEDDFRIIKKYGLYQNQHVGPDGLFRSDCEQYSSRYFREEGLDIEIVKDLAARGLLFDKYRHEHSYPFCWRCKSALMYFAKLSWFIRTTEIRDQMIAENKKIKWQPAHIRDGRFGKWLENNVDWAVSRDRYWGSPLNIWTAEDDKNKRLCPASVAELQSLGAYFESTGEKVPSEFDLHIPIIDDVVIRDSEGTLYRRETGVLDCWFNAGVMPWGQFGYPVKEGSSAMLESQYPADFICEAIDQTRGWFYTLLAVSTLVSGKSSFKSVICTELILDANGKKMSKSIGNVIDPVPLIEEFGADAVRWTFYNSDPWQVKRYSEELPREALRAVFIPIWNCYSFFITYALLDKWVPDDNTGNPSQIELDRWILSCLKSSIAEVTSALEQFDVATAAAEITTFIDSLSNWYIRRSRKRFWKSDSDKDKQCAYATLYEVLVTLSKLIAPMAPFMAEVMYQNLVCNIDKRAPESVHLCQWPDAGKLTQESALENEIALIREAAGLGRALRVEHNLKIRQPLQQLLLSPADIRNVDRIKRHITSLAEELNVRDILVVDNSADFIDLTVKPNWKVLGPRFGKKIQLVNQIVKGLSSGDVALIGQGKSIGVVIDGEKTTLAPEELVIEQSAKEGMVARSGQFVTVALSTILTTDLIREGDARELVSTIQRQRKNLGFEISDRIFVQVWGSKEIGDAITEHQAEIAKECLAVELLYRGEIPNTQMKAVEKFNVNDHEIALELLKQN